MFLSESDIDNIRSSQPPQLNQQQSAPASHYSQPHVPQGQFPQSNGITIDHNEQIDPQRYRSTHNEG